MAERKNKPELTRASSGFNLERVLEDVSLAAALIALAALSSPISQLTLAPVYGSLPSAVNHRPAIATTFLLGFVLHHYLGASPPRDPVRRYLPLIAVLIPAVEHLLFQFSEQLGPVGGPILTGFCSCHVAIIAAAFSTAQALDRLGLNSNLGRLPASAMNAVAALVPFLLLERILADQLPGVVAQSRLLTPADLQLIVAAAFALLRGPSPSVVVITWLLIILTYVFNPRGSGPYASAALDASLAPQGWTVLARRWGTSGYVSVVQDTRDDYRVLRCDHSLLGGEWLVNDARRAQGWTGNEPVYSVFSMLEAVRLVEVEGRAADAEATALVVGLGVGSAPAALVRHGVATTVVELDPVVHEFATRFFGLPANHTAVLEDAVGWVRRQAAAGGVGAGTYDYIVHDVFTGGAEPLALFTAEFLRGLRALLGRDGVAAINYAGDVRAALTARVLNTIDLVFERRCRLFSDDGGGGSGGGGGDDGDETETQTQPFSNLIVFCRASAGALTFRAPTPAAFLGSHSRRHYLLPRPEQELAFPLRDAADAAQRLRTLEADDLGAWARAQASSSTEHWRIMRTVLPARVWELY